MRRFNPNVSTLQEGHKYYVRVFARNEVGLSEPLETEEPVKVIRPPGNVHFQTISALVRAKRPIQLDVLPSLFQKKMSIKRGCFHLSCISIIID
jgi:hypothetical protein